mmetsp:Transcript_70271/g.228449  ORF Transcript_70271/g.228449 Transcript_70271/m.228449 type:complete len:226 (-) Transcript_70271:16-693(-)
MSPNATGRQTSLPRGRIEALPKAQRLQVRRFNLKSNLFTHLSCCSLCKLLAWVDGPPWADPRAREGSHLGVAPCEEHTATSAGAGGNKEDDDRQPHEVVSASDGPLAERPWRHWASQCILEGQRADGLMPGEYVAGAAGQNKGASSALACPRQICICNPGAATSRAASSSGGGKSTRGCGQKHGSARSGRRRLVQAPSPQRQQQKRRRRRSGRRHRTARAGGSEL